MIKKIIIYTLITLFSLTGITLAGRHDNRGYHRGHQNNYQHYGYRYKHYGHRDYHPRHYRGHWRSWYRWHEHYMNHRHLYRHGRYYRHNGHLYFSFEAPDGTFTFSIGR